MVVFGANIGSLFFNDSAMLKFIFNLLGMGIGFVLALPFIIFGLVALFLDVRNYGLFIAGVILFMIILVVPFAPPFDDIIGSAVSIYLIALSTKKKR